MFAQTGMLHGVSTNLYFIEHGEQIIHTSAKLDTDPYGKPAMVYEHDGGAEGIATQLRELLDHNLHARLAMRLYSGGIRDARLQELQAQPTATVLKEAEQASAPPKEEKPEIEPPVISLYDLFGFTAEERRIAQTGGNPRRRSNRPKLAQPRQPSLFDTPIKATAKTAQPVQTATADHSIENGQSRLESEAERQRRHEEDMQTPDRSTDYWSRTIARGRSSR